jgi:cell wall assembly regulator SMI1
MGWRLSLMAITWETYIWDAPHPATVDELELLEREWGVKLPEDYTQIAMSHQGMAPNPCILDVGRSNTAVSELLTLSVDPERRSYAMSQAYQVIKHLVPAGIYPFAGTGTGDFICFDYRVSPAAPTVVFYFTEAPGPEALYPVADNFTEFLSKLHD